MKRLFVSIPVLAALALPAAAQADPNKTDKTNAAKECRSERGTTSATREAFKAKYGTNANKSNAFGKCVSKRSKSEEAQRKSAASNAAKDCKAERAADAEAFKTKYGTNKNGNNAYGKCVSQKAKAKKDAADAGRRQGHRQAQVRRQDLRHRAQGRRGRVQGQVRHERQQEQRVRQVRLGHGQEEVRVLGAPPGGRRIRRRS